jgi:hypothetical protein
MSNFFVANDQIPISQKSVRIPAENGTNYIANQEIRLRIDPSVRFFLPTECYLEANIKVIPQTYTTDPLANPTLSTPTKLSLDAETGFQSLIRRVTIRDSNGTVLEEIDSYNTMVSVMYDYQTNQSLRGKRALTEGSSCEFPDSRGTSGTTRSVANNTKNNVYWRTPASVVGVLGASWTADDFVDAKVCIPLHTGIMSNSKIFPNMLMGQNGITITILLEDNSRAFRQLDGAMRFRRLPLNPRFRGRTLAGGSVGQNGSFNQVYFHTDNCIHSTPQALPFAIGERLGFQRLVTGNASLVVFQNASGEPVIKEIEMEGGYVRVTLNASVEVLGKGMDGLDVRPASQKIYAYSRSVSDATTYEPTYLVSNVNLIVQSVSAGEQYEREMFRKMKEGGTINYDFLSTTCYKHSQLASDRVANIRLPINNTRCKSLLCVPTDATNYSTKQTLNASETYNLIATEESVASDCPDFYLRSNRPGLEGITDGIIDFQFLYDQRLQPNRRVSCVKTANSKSIDAQHLILLDQALSQAGITGHSFQRFNQNFILGKPLALGDGVYDGRNKDFSLQVNYADTSVKNKLWCCYVHHIRRLVISGDSVRLEV